MLELKLNPPKELVPLRADSPWIWFVRWLLVVLCVEQLGLEGLITREGLFDDSERGVGGANLLYLDLFAFELFVILKKAPQDKEAMRGKIAGLDVIAELRIARGDGDNFVVARAGVEPGHDADGAGFNEGERLNGLLAKNEDVEGIVVFGVGLGGEAVVRG